MPISYPIQDSDRFTVWDTNTNAPLKDGRGRPMQGVKWGSNDLTQMVPNLAPNIKWLQEQTAAKPTYDPDTQKLEQTKVEDVADGTVLTSWNVVALTQAELDAKARQADIEATRQTMKAAHVKLMDGTATADQVRKIVAWLLKREGLDLDPPA